MPEDNTEELIANWQSQVNQNEQALQPQEKEEWEQLFSPPKPVYDDTLDDTDRNALIQNYNNFTDNSWGATATDIGVGAVQGLTFGFGDEIADTLGFDFYSEQKKLSEERSPWIVLGGELAGALPFFVVPGAGALRAGVLGEKATKLGTIGKKLYGVGQAANKSKLGRLATSRPIVYGAEGAAYGGLYGAGEYQAFGAENRLEGAGIGALTGFALPAGAIGAYNVSKLGGKLALKGAGKVTGFDKVAATHRYQRGTDEFVSGINGGNTIFAGSGDLGRQGKYTIDKVFNNAAGKFIGPTIGEAYKFLDKLPVKIGNKTVNTKFEYTAAKRSANDISDKSLQNRLKANNPTFQDAAQLRFDLDSYAAKKGGLEGEKVKLAVKRITQDINAAAKKYDVVDSVRSIDAYAIKAKEAFQSDLAQKLLKSEKTAHQFVTNLSRNTATKGDVANFKRILDYIKKTESRDNKKLDETFNRLKAEVAYSFLNEQPKAIDAITNRNFQDARNAMRALFGDKDWGKLKNLAYEAKRLQQKYNINTKTGNVAEGSGVFSSNLVGTLVAGAGGFASGGLFPGIFTSLGFHWSRQWTKSLTQQLLQSRNPKDGKLLRRLIDYADGKIKGKDVQVLKSAVQAKMSKVQDDK